MARMWLVKCNIGPNPPPHQHTPPVASAAVRSKAVIILLLIRCLLLLPTTLQSLHICSKYVHQANGAASVEDRSFVSVRYFLNQWMNFDPTCIDTLLGKRKESIRFVDLDLIFKSQTSNLKSQVGRVHEALFPCVIF